MVWLPNYSINDCFVGVEIGTEFPTSTNSDRKYPIFELLFNSIFESSSSDFSKLSGPESYIKLPEITISNPILIS